MKTRVLSAVLALLLLAAVYFVFRTGGLLVLAALATGLGIAEFSRLVFRPLSSAAAPPLMFGAFCFVIYLGFAYWHFQSEALFAILSILFVAFLLLTQAKEAKNLATVSTQQGLGVMGFLYCGLFPALATRLLMFPKGDLWFFTLLAVVFVGDSGAYFVGRLWGRTKLMPHLSPKKTLKGALGGLGGSLTAALVAWALAFSDLNPWLFAGLGLVTGCFAQIGDLFESLLKRIAQVKDSGQIMPGHGGVLDRLDGVFFGGPIFYYLVKHLFI